MTSSASANLETAAPLLPNNGTPEIIDRRYVLKRILASGGGAKVWAAEHVHTRRAVALKLPLDASDSTRARMQREVEVLARVRGHRIVEMLDAGEANGMPFIVFELLEGRTLAGLLVARGRLSPDQSIKVGVEVARALAHCHARGVVHRDIKPSNLFVTPASRVCVLDFGIAKLLTDETEAKLTHDHALVGTPEYMAPEALLSSPEIDPRADVYGLGVTLFECLTGHVPFDGDYVQVLLKLSTTASRRIEEFRPDVPPELSRVVEKCLARAPEDRWRSMEELGAALAHCAVVPPAGVNLLTPGLPATGSVGRDTPTITDSPQARTAAAGVSRRRFPRAPYMTLARILSGQGNVVDGRIEEVSEGGVQFVGERAIEKGETVSIRFSLPASGRVASVTAVARWNRSARGTNATGFEFQEITDAARNEIRQYVSVMGASPPLS